MQMDVTEHNDHYTLIRLVGRLDLAGVGAIELRFGALCSGAKGAAIIDMNGVDFVASLGMGMLVSAARTAKGRGKPMMLMGVQPPVAEALRAAALHQLLPMVDDMAAAEAQLGKSAG
jgi:anti-anti-sigma factor